MWYYVCNNSMVPQWTVNVKIRCKLLRKEWQLKFKLMINSRLIDLADPCYVIMSFASWEPELVLIFQVSSHQYSTEERDFSFLCSTESQFAFSVSTFNLASSRTTAPSQQLWDHLALVVDLHEVSVGIDLELFQVSSDKPLLFALSALAVCLMLPSDLLSVFSVTSLILLFQLWNDSGPSISPWGHLLPTRHEGIDPCLWRLLLLPIFDMQAVPPARTLSASIESAGGEGVRTLLKSTRATGTALQSHHFSLQGQLSWTSMICLW